MVLTPVVRPPRRWRHVAGWAAFALLYVAVAMRVYGPASAGAWCCDDTQILGHALRYPPWQYFVDPAAWRALVPFSLTPWLSLSYRIDLALFGVQPAGFYVHQQLALASCAGLIHLLLRRRTGHVPALSAALLFLGGVPVAQAAHMLAVRHYVEGLAALLLCLWLVQQQATAPRNWRPWALAAAFAVAVSAKEVYVPLGLAALLIGPGSIAARVRRAAPVLAVMALYVPWRAHMLGELVGGYVPAGEVAWGDMLRLALVQMAAAPGLLWTDPRPALATLALAGGLVAAGMLHIHRAQAVWPLARAIGAGLGVAALVLLPLVPLATYPGLGAGSERYFFVAWATLSLAVGAAAAGLRPRWPRAAALLAALTAATLLACAWPSTQHALAAARVTHHEHQVHFDALITRGPGDVVQVAPTVAPWFVSGALALRPALGQPAPGPRVVVDASDWLAIDLQQAAVWRHDPAQPGMVDGRAAALQQRADAAAGLRVRPLQVAMTYDASTHVLRWRMGAGETGGAFTLVATGVRQPVPVAQGALRIGQPLPPCFRIRHDAPDGTHAYTPWLSLQPRDGVQQQLDWSGPAEPLSGLAHPAAC